MAGYENFESLSAKHPEMMDRGWTLEWLIRLHRLGLISAKPDVPLGVWIFSETMLEELLRFRPVLKPQITERRIEGDGD